MHEPDHDPKGRSRNDPVNKPCDDEVIDESGARLNKRAATGPSPHHKSPRPPAPRRVDIVEEAGKESFPASDAPARHNVTRA